MLHELEFPECIAHDEHPAGFILQLRRSCDLAEKAVARLGHPVKVGVRIPTRPDDSLALGMDFVTWAKKGWIDWIVPCNYFFQADFDLPYADWLHRVAAVNPKVMVVPGLDAQLREKGLRQLTREEYAVFADRVYRQGAPGVYIFNPFCHKSATGVWRSLVDEGLPPALVAERAKGVKVPKGYDLDPQQTRGLTDKTLTRCCREISKDDISRTAVADFVIAAFGARTDAAPAANAAAIQKAIDAAAAVPGGGRVVVPAGEWVSGTIWLKSGVELHLEKGAVLKASPNLADYNREDAYPENFGCPKSEYWRGFHFIICRCAENVSITGEGTIHGNGDVFFDEKPVNYSWNPPTALCWWDGIRWAKDTLNLRPGQLIVFVKCGNLRVEGITIRNSPCWSLYFYGCHDVIVRNYTARNGLCDANTDGVDIDCCRNVLVEDIDVMTGDDGVAIRGAGRRLGLDPQPPCENIVVRRARLDSSSSVFRIGVGDGFIRNVTVEDVTSGRGGTAINLNACYGSRETGGVDMENIVFRRYRFDNCREAYNIHAAGKKQTFGIRNVIFEDVTFTPNARRHIGADAGSPAPANVLIK